MPVGNIVLPKNEQELHFKGPEVVSTWRVATEFKDEVTKSPMWFLEDRTIESAAPHADVLHFLFTARSPSGPYEQGAVSVPQFGFGIGDLPGGGEWVSRRALQIKPTILPAGDFAVPAACLDPLPWQSNGAARHFLNEIA